MKTKMMKRCAIRMMFFIAFSLYAQANGQNRSSGEIDPEFNAGRQWLVLIAISDYEEWPSLQYPVADARALKETLVRDYHIDKVKVLYNEDATRSNIAKFFVALQAELTVRDSLLIYYAGHGYLDKNSDTGFWIPYDAGKNHFEQKNWIVNAQVRGYISNFKSSHICLIMDSCFSGDMLETKRGHARETGEAYYRKAYGRTSRQIITSGASESVPDRSEFARLLVMTLEKNSLPYLDPLAIYDDVRLGMTATSPLFGSLRGTGHQDGASFLLFRKRNMQSKAAEDDSHTNAILDLAKEKLPPDADKKQLEKQSGIDRDIKMVGIESGEFVMGAKTGVNNERPAHRVTIKQFMIASFETTFNEYDAYCEATGKARPSDKSWGRDDRPVINVSWIDAVGFCNWRSTMEGLTHCYTIRGSNVTCNFDANGYRLPTEAEWECAARGRLSLTDILYSGSGNVNDVAWYKDNAGKKTHPVGKKNPNDTGLYDMSGNVWEWCWDVYDSNYYANSPERDPAGPESGTERVLRGGSWYNGPVSQKVTARGHESPNRSSDMFGFRVVRSIR